MRLHKVPTWRQSIDNISCGIFGLCRKEKQSRASTVFRFTGTGEAVSSVGNKTSKMDNFYLWFSVSLPHRQHRQSVRGFGGFSRPLLPPQRDALLGQAAPGCSSLRRRLIQAPCPSLSGDTELQKVSPDSLKLQPKKKKDLWLVCVCRGTAPQSAIQR